ncbi:MAG: lytic transglycosylase domain-containing protein [Proteobacteria bacterium]|nr:lytic transglycosylase domain-containing protein [Pseudomonadota bacterium]
MDFLLITVLAGSLGMGQPAQTSQVQVKLPSSLPANCVQAAADRYSVPAMLLLAIVKWESRGKQVMNCRNAAGGCDLGISQINSQWWAPYLMKNYGIQPERLMNDNCQALMAQSYILRKESQSAQCKGDLWCAAARYHSPNSADLQRQYIAKVWDAHLGILQRGAF